MSSAVASQIPEIPDAVLQQLMELSQTMPDELKNKFAQLLAPALTFGELKGLKPKTLETMYGIAYTLYQSNQYQKAREIFRTLTLLNHFESKYFYGLACCYQMEKNYKLAVENFGLAFLLEPEDPTIPYHSAYCHLMMKDYQAAESGFYAAAEWAGDKPQFAELKRQAQSLEKVAKRKLAAEKNSTEAEG